MLVFFGFTNCPNVCPPTLQKIRQVQRSLNAPEANLMGRVCLGRWRARHTRTHEGVPASVFAGVCRTDRRSARVKDLATAFSAVFFKGMPTDTAGGYNMEHTSQVYLVDRSGRLRATFYNAPADDMAKVTAQVLAERS